jgi:hypothetical protein
MPIIAGRASAAVGAGFSRVVTAAYAGPFGAYDSLASTTVGATAVSSITFSGIPTGYKHLQIRWTGLSDDTSASGVSHVRAILFFNADTTTTNYYNHFLIGDGANTSAGAENTAKFAGNATRNSMIAPCPNIVDILDYASTSINKTVRTLTGYNNNDATNNTARLVSGAWNNTAAITSIQLTLEAGNLKQFTKVSLYGVK